VRLGKAHQVTVSQMMIQEMVKEQVDVIQQEGSFFTTTPTTSASTPNLHTSPSSRSTSFSTSTWQQAPLSPLSLSPLSAATAFQLFGDTKQTEVTEPTWAAPVKAEAHEEDMDDMMPAATSTPKAGSPKSSPKAVPVAAEDDDSEFDEDEEEESEEAAAPPAKAKAASPKVVPQAADDESDMDEDEEEESEDAAPAPAAKAGSPKKSPIAAPVAMDDESDFDEDEEEESEDAAPPAKAAASPKKSPIAAPAAMDSDDDMDEDEEEESEEDAPATKASSPAKTAAKAPVEDPRLAGRLMHCRRSLFLVAFVVALLWFFAELDEVKAKIAKNFTEASTILKTAEASSVKALVQSHGTFEQIVGTHANEAFNKLSAVLGDRDWLPKLTMVLFASVKQMFPLEVLNKVPQQHLEAFFGSIGLVLGVVVYIRSTGCTA